MVTNNPFRAAALCDRCRVLQFDDIAAGGFEILNRDNDPMLQFEQGLTNATSDEIGRIFISIDLDYSIQDTLPDLAVLTESSKYGCQFCGMLRTSILHHPDVEFGDEISVSLSYTWLKGAGLYSLNAKITGKWFKQRELIFPIKGVHGNTFL